MSLSLFILQKIILTSTFVFTTVNSVDIIHLNSFEFWKVCSYVHVQKKHDDENWADRFDLDIQTLRKGNLQIS